VIAKFGDFTLDSDSRQLTRGREPLHLSRKAFDALCVLLERRPNAVTKEELHARLWPGTFVVDANLSVAIAEIRRALDDDAQAPRFIRTVHRIGYAFCWDAPGTAREKAGDADRRAWLVWNDRVLRLGEGENVIGRDPECQVWLDVRGVSRRHACIRVIGEAATIEDLGSKNGTSVNDSPVGPAQPLSDGDSLRLGGATLGFRMSSSANATETIRLEKPR
jgi:DNA-binding winged helix-turn-helix (wHTH) protein